MSNDHDEIKSLIYAYARGVDRRDAELIQSVFTEDAQLDFGGFLGSPAEFARMAGVGIGALRASHHNMTNILLAIDGDAASGETYCMAWHGVRDDDPGALDYTAYVRYLDRFVRTKAGWRITHRKVIQDAKQLFPKPTETPRSILPTEIPSGARDRTDPSYALTPGLGGPRRD